MSMRKTLLLLIWVISGSISAQINTDRVMEIGRNALYFEDYVLSIQYFSQVISAKPYLPEPYFYRGLAKMNLEDYQGAEEDCSLSIERNPFVASAYQVRGLSRIHLKKYDDATSDYLKAISFDPYNVGIRHNLALCYLQKNDFKEADAALDSLIKINPNYQAAYLMEAESSLKQRDTLRAVTNLTKAIELDKFSGDAYQARAGIYMQQSKWKEAKEDYGFAIKYTPKEVGNYINRALANYHLLKYNETLADYDSAIELDPNNFLVHYNRGLLRAQFGDENRAISDFSFVLQKDPNNFMAVFNRGILRNKTGDYRGAIRDISTVIRRYPNFLAGYQFRATAYRKIGNITAATHDEMKLMRANLDMRFGGNKWRKKAPLASHKTRRMSDKDMEKYNQIVEADKEESNDSIYKNEYRGKIQNKKVEIRLEPMFALTYYEKQAEIKRSVHYYKGIDDINNHHSLPRRLFITNQEVALDQQQIKDQFTSVDKLTPEIIKYPKNVRYRYARALDYYLLKDQSNALTDLNEVLNIDSRFYPAYFTRALIRWKQLDYEESEEIKNVKGKVEEVSTIDIKNPAYDVIKEDYDKVIGLAPDFAYAYYNRGIVMCALHDYQSALADFTTAIQLDSNLGEAYYNRGLTNVFAGNNQAGINDLSKAGELGVVEAYNVIKRLTK